MSRFVADEFISPVPFTRPPKATYGRGRPRNPVWGDAVRIDGWTDARFRVDRCSDGTVDVTRLDPGAARMVLLRGVPLARVRTRY